jgi:hypothetical protein
MKLVCYHPEHKNIWDDFVRGSKNGLFMFQRDYMDYHADRFHDHSLMAYSDDGKLVAVLPANHRDGVLYSHQGLTFGGFVTGIGMKAGAMLNLFEALVLYLRANHFQKLIYKAIPHIYHRVPAEEDLYGLFRQNAHLYRVDISTTVSLSNRVPFSELRKRGIKKAEKNQVVYRQSDDWSSFMGLLSSVLQDRHDTQPVHSVDEMILLSGKFPDHIKLYVAEKQGQIVAGVVLFIYDHLVHAQYIAASESGREVGALDGLFGMLINDVFQDKTYFDFGISTENAGQFLNDGLIGQKEGFGGRGIAHQFYEVVVSPHE